MNAALLLAHSVVDQVVTMSLVEDERIYVKIIYTQIINTAASVKTPSPVS